MTISHVNEADRLIGIYRLKSLHGRYIEGYITYFDYREDLLLTINQIRESLKLEVLSEGDFDMAWQHREMWHESWKIARLEILSTTISVY